MSHEGKNGKLIYSFEISRKDLKRLEKNQICLRGEEVSNRIKINYFLNLSNSPGSPSVYSRQNNDKIELYLNRAGYNLLEERGYITADDGLGDIVLKLK